MIINTKRNWIKSTKYQDSDLKPDKTQLRRCIKRFRSDNHLGRPLQIISNNLEYYY